VTAHSGGPAIGSNVVIEGPPTMNGNHLSSQSRSRNGDLRCFSVPAARNSGSASMLRPASTAQI
jgi:hypothetical protein